MSTPIPSLLEGSHPLLWYIYGLFKAEAVKHEWSVLSRFSKTALPNLDQQVINNMPSRVREAFGNCPYLSEEMLHWFFFSKEFTNYTYDLTPASYEYLISFVDIVTGCSYQKAETYIAELLHDEPLKAHIRAIVQSKLSSSADMEVFYGRRLGWYAFVRHFKPKVIVETGLDKGMGSLVLSRALLRNAEEGAPGKYFGIDIDANAGAMYAGEYAKCGQILRGDSVALLNSFNEPIDFLIADSSHAEGYEGKEYAAIAEKLSPNAVIISDADYAALSAFARRTQRRFLFWPEWPKDHFVHGAGIAIAYK